MDYRKDTQTILREFEKLTTAEMLIELKWLYNRSDCADQVARNIFPAVAFIYINRLEKEKAHLVTGTA